MNDDNDDIEQSAAPLIEHLTELRNRLIRSVVAFAICMIFAFTIASQIFVSICCKKNLSIITIKYGKKPIYEIKNCKLIFLYI